MRIHRQLAAGVVLLTVALGLGATSSPSSAEDVTLPPIPSLPGLPIPSLPTDLLVPKFIGSEVTANPLAHPAIPQNPYLAPNGRSSMHNDSYSSDAYRVSGPLGRQLTVRSASYGVRECATITFDSQGRIEALCGGLDGFMMMLIDPVTLKPIDELAMPGRNLLSLSNPFTDICGGTYFYLTNDDRAIALTTKSEIWEVSQVGGKLARTRSWPIASHLGADDCLVAVTADWDGRAWWFSQDGAVGTLDLDTGQVQALELPEGEGMFNSVSADETGGVYAVTTHATYRFDADETGAPAVTWREAYDRGTRVKPGMLSQGSGTSPTLIGDRWIVIADNAEHMNVLVYDRRADVDGPRLHCSTPVFTPGAGATENSLVAAGNSVIVENNYGYAGPQSTLLGASTAPGITRVLIRDEGCPVAWTNPSIAPTSVPKSSLGNGLLYAYTKPVRADLIDAWYLTAIDIRTGNTAWSRLTGTGIQWNNHYASIYLGPDGAAYIAVLAGLIRIADKP